MIKLDKNDIVIFSGDSITEGARKLSMDCNHVLGHGYQYTVAGELALEYAAEGPKFANKGYSGYTMTRLLEQWEDDIIKNKPTVVSILAGVNDAASGFHQGKTPAETAELYFSSLCRAIEMTQNALPGVRIIVCEPFYFPLDKSDLTLKDTPHYECEAYFRRPDSDETPEQMKYMTETVDLLRVKAKEAADKYSCGFVPFYDSFAAAIAGSKREYFTWDGTHPTVAGHAVLAKQWLKATADM